MIDSVRCGQGEILWRGQMQLKERAFYTTSKVVVIAELGIKIRMDRWVGGFRKAFRSRRLHLSMYPP